MLNFILFLSFIVYIFFIFATQNLIFEIIILLINFIIMISFKVSLRKAFTNLLFLMPFILITGIFNLFFGNLYESFFITFKLILVCNITYIFKVTVGTTNIIKAIETLFFPLKLFGISPTNISLIINVSLTFIPNLIRDLNEIKNTLKSKSCINLFEKNTYTFKILLTSIFKKTNDLELALKAKGFSE